MAERISSGMHDALAPAPEVLGDTSVESLQRSFVTFAQSLNIPVPQGWSLEAAATSGQVQINSIEGSGIYYVGIPTLGDSAYVLSEQEGEIVVGRIPASGEDPVQVSDEWVRAEVASFALGYTTQVDYQLVAVTWESDPKVEYNHFVRALASEVATEQSRGIRFRDSLAGISGFRVTTATVADSDGQEHVVSTYEYCSDNEQHHELVAGDTASAEWLLLAAIMGSYDIDKTSNLLVSPRSPVPAEAVHNLSDRRVGNYVRESDLKTAWESARRTSFSFHRYQELNTLIKAMNEVDVYAFQRIKDHRFAQQQCLLDILSNRPPEKEAPEGGGVHVVSVGGSGDLVVKLVVQDAGISETYELRVARDQIDARQVTEVVNSSGWRHEAKTEIVRTEVGQSEKAILLEAIAGNGMGGSILRKSILARAQKGETMYRPSVIPDDKFDTTDNSKKNKIPMHIRHLKSIGYFSDGAVVHRSASGGESWYIKQKLEISGGGLFWSGAHTRESWFRVDESRDKSPLVPQAVLVEIKDPEIVGLLNRTCNSIMPVDV